MLTKIIDHSRQPDLDHHCRDCGATIDGPLVHLVCVWESLVMSRWTSGWVPILAGVVLVVIYSGIMIATEGSASWAWLLLVAGVALLVFSGRPTGQQGDE